MALVGGKIQILAIYHLRTIFHLYNISFPNFKNAPVSRCIHSSTPTQDITHLTLAPAFHPLRKSKHPTV